MLPFPPVPGICCALVQESKRRNASSPTPFSSCRPGPPARPFRLIEDFCSPRSVSHFPVLLSTLALPREPRVRAAFALFIAPEGRFQSDSRTCGFPFLSLPSPFAPRVAAEVGRYSNVQVNFHRSCPRPGSQREYPLGTCATPTMSGVRRCDEQPCGSHDPLVPAWCASDVSIGKYSFTEVLPRKSTH